MHDDFAFSSGAGLLLYLLNTFAHVDVKIDVMCFSLLAQEKKLVVNPVSKFTV